MSNRRNFMTNLPVCFWTTCIIVDESCVLGKQGIVKPVTDHQFGSSSFSKLSGQRQNLPWCRQAYSVSMPLRKGLCLALAFFRKYRAGGVQQVAAGFQRFPQGIHYLFLQRCGTRHIFLPAQPANVWVAAHHARSRAWNIRQYGVERPAVPPRLQIGGVRTLQLHTVVV